MVIDDETGVRRSRSTGRRKNLTETRDYAVVTTHRARSRRRSSTCFEADWDRKEFDPGTRVARSSGAPNNGRERIAAVHRRGASTRCWLQNERYQDAVIIERLVRAARPRRARCTSWRAPPHTLKKDKLVEGVGGLRIMHDVGAKVHKLKGLKLHAKMLLADGERAIVGSINLAPGSFDARRELAIEVDDHHVVEAAAPTCAQHDWEHSTPLDLSDEGLLADLEKRGGEGAEKLALNVGKKEREKGTPEKEKSKKAKRKKAKR